MGDDMGPRVRAREVSVPIWDLPVRLFHWAIVLLVGFSWLSAEMEWMDWHLRSGYAALTLLLFRWIWGLVGSQTARFAGFLAGPRAVLHHLARLRRREPDREIGHNAVGGWMVLVLLVLLSVQAGTGLFANDDVMTQGPCADAVGKDTSDWLTHIHRLNFTLIEVAVALHVLAVLGYAVVKRQNLVWPMLTGRKRLPPELPAPRMRGSVVAIVVFAVAVGVATFIVNHPW